MKQCHNKCLGEIVSSRVYASACLCLCLYIYIYMNHIRFGLSLDDRGSALTSAKSIAIAPPTYAMGTLPPGTKCVYCGVHEAGYIPDGCSGPICFSPESGDWDGCWDIVQELGWDFVETEYMKRCWLAKVRPLRQANHQLRNFEQSIAVNIASCLFDV